MLFEKRAQHISKGSCSVRAGARERVSLGLFDILVLARAGHAVWQAPCEWLFAQNRIRAGVRQSLSRIPRGPGPLPGH